MAKEVFTNQTVNILSPVFQIGSDIQVDVSGVLDGADVNTYYIAPGGAKAIIAKCSWRTSVNDTLTVADSGQQPILGIGAIQFEILNAGAGTNISLSYYTNSM